MCLTFFGKRLEMKPGADSDDQSQAFKRAGKGVKDWVDWLAVRAWAR